MKEIADLTRLAKCLPEDQQRQIFTEEQLPGFIEAVFNAKAALEENEKSSEERRERVLQLCFRTLWVIGKIDNALELAGDVMDVFREAGEGSGVIVGLKAVYIKGHSQRRVKSKNRRQATHQLQKVS